MSEPEDGYRVSVRVSIDVPMIYYRASGTMRAGWVAEERFSVLGFAAEEEAIVSARAHWVDVARGYAHHDGTLTPLGKLIAVVGDEPLAP